MGVSTIQVADETFVAASPAAVGRAVGDRAGWRRWFPDLLLEVVEDRAEKGVRWTVTGPLTGTMEIWLEPVLDGVVLHYYLHAEPAGAAGWRHDRQRRRSRRWAITAVTAVAARNGLTPMSTRRVSADGASLVCSVENTK